jgi:tRNA threonylcarbamoyladenosine biosynthesis protein TsaE
MKPGRPLARLESSGPEETRRIGRELGRILRAGEVLALEGELGSGKTVLVQGLAEGLGIENPDAIQSPTFALVQEHRGPGAGLCHADLYRLAALEGGEIGIEEYWDPAGGGSEWVSAVEWADRAERLLPEDRRVLRLRIETVAKDRRHLFLYGPLSWKKRLSGLLKKS